MSKWVAITNWDYKVGVGLRFVAEQEAQAHADNMNKHLETWVRKNLSGMKHSGKLNLNHGSFIP